VVAINEVLSTEPQKINEDAYAAWMYKVKATNPVEIGTLLDAVGYRKVVESEAH
jgi:glycine cleavage system H protein